MKITHAFIGVVASGMLGSTAFAQVVQQDQQRDVNQQERIEQGLQSGELSTHEAGQLERGQQQIDHMEAHDLKNGTVSAGEQARLNAAENKESAAIYGDKHNGVTGNPNSASSQRMQADVQRNVNQQQRIDNGIKNGSLTHREAGSLERGQAHVDRREANAGANGRVGRGEQRRIQTAENRQSGRIYNKKHNAKVRS
jgi:hypothetical protein